MACHKRTKECLAAIREPEHITREQIESKLDSVRDTMAKVRYQIAAWRNHVDDAEAKESSKAVRQRLPSARQNYAAMSNTVEVICASIAELQRQLEAHEQHAENLALAVEE